VNDLEEVGIKKRERRILERVDEMSVMMYFLDSIRFGGDIHA